MEGVTKSKKFAEHLVAMHEAREAFVKAESSAALKKAMKSKIFPRGADISEVDWVHYKKDDRRSKSRIWRGPAQVAAVNG